MAYPGFLKGEDVPVIRVSRIKEVELGDKGTVEILLPDSEVGGGCAIHWGGLVCWVCWPLWLVLRG